MAKKNPSIFSTLQKTTANASAVNGEFTRQLPVDALEDNPMNRFSMAEGEQFTSTMASVEADGFPLQWKPGEFLLLCSDGLVNTVTDQEIMFEILHNGQPEDCLQRLMAISKQRGAPDNVTAILLMND